MVAVFYTAVISDGSVALCADDFESFVSCAKHLWDFQRECSVLPPSSSRFSLMSSHCFSTPTINFVCLNTFAIL
jgi:hypothetical protein